MLTNVPLRTLPETEITVIGDVGMAHTINLLATVLLARKPRITAPPTSSIWGSLSDPKKAEELMRALEHAKADPFFLRIGAAKRVLDEKEAIGELDANWLAAVSSIGLEGMLAFPTVTLDRVPSLVQNLRTLQDENKMDLSLPSKPTMAEMIEKDAIRVPFTNMAIDMAYEQIVRGGAFDKLQPVENTAEKAPYAAFERGLLMLTLVRVLSIQTMLLRLRPTLRYLRMEASRERLRQDMIPANVEYWEALIDRVLALPVHPWIALAEQPSVPTSRLTPWGIVPTILMERTVLRCPWNGVGEKSRSERVAYAQSMTAQVDPVLVLEQTQPLLLALRDFLNTVEVEGRFAKVASMMSFTTVGGPLQIPLWGEAFRPVHMDGLNATESITDFLPLIFQPHLPAQAPDGSPWVGEDERMMYTGAARADGDLAAWEAKVGSIALAPEDVLADQSFYAGRYSPAVLQFVKDAYLGDVDAYRVPATVEGVATLFGRSKDEMTALVKADPAPWAHIFTIGTRGQQGVEPPLGGFPIVPTRPSEQLFVSARTQLTWLTTVPLPRRGVPTTMVAVRKGRPIVIMPVTSRFWRDGIVPAPTVPMQGAIDRLIAAAIPSPLTGLIKP